MNFKCKYYKYIRRNHEQLQKMQLYRVYKKNWTDLKLLSIPQNSYYYPVFYIYGFFGYL
jgi:hypothetical protein